MIKDNISLKIDDEIQYKFKEQFNYLKLFANLDWTVQKVNYAVKISYSYGKF